MTMAEINAHLVKQLRDMTGAGMMDCKKALVATGGDLEEAVVVSAQARNRVSGQEREPRHQARVLLSSARMRGLGFWLKSIASRISSRARKISRPWPRMSQRT